MNPEYVFSAIWVSKCSYQIYEKNQDKYFFVDESGHYFDTLQECQEAAILHINSLIKGGNKNGTL